MSSAAWGLYAHPFIYGYTMRLLYGRRYTGRYQAIVAHIPAGAQVVDVCAGDAYLYREFLKHRGVDYLALDISPQMVAWVRRRGVNARAFDLWSEAVPPAEYIVLQASLYQFTPHSQAVLERLLEAAQTRLLVAEPVVNLAASPNPLLARLGHALTIPAGPRERYEGRRFDRESFTRLAQSFPSLEKINPIPGGREMVAVFAGASAAVGPEATVAQ